MPGPQIGEALGEVDAHCADSGQSPAEALGDPVRYAAARAAGVSGRSFWRTALRAWSIGAAGHLPVLVAGGAMALAAAGLPMLAGWRRPDRVLGARPSA